MTLSKWMIAICLSALPLVAGPLDGTWKSYPLSALPAWTDSLNEIVSDSSGTVYFLTRKTTYAFNGSGFDTLPAPLELSSDGAILPTLAHVLSSPSDFWTRESHMVFPGHFPEDMLGSVSHWVNGIGKVVSGPNCLEGNMFDLLGKDADGNMIIDRRTWYGLGSGKSALLRFSEQHCDSIDLKWAAEMGASAYARDTADREYFGTQIKSDFIEAGPVVRLDKGTLDTLIQNVHVTGMAPLGAQVLVAGRTGLWLTTETGARQINSIQGQALASLRAPFLDREGAVWLAGQFPGLIALSGQDTVRYSTQAAGFAAPYSGGFAEDAQGNIWTYWSGDKSLKVFVRGTAPVSLRKRAESGNKPQAIPGSRNALGREMPQGKTRLRGFGAKAMEKGKW